MTRKFTFRLHELHSLHANLRVLFILMLLLTLVVLAYIAARVFLLRERISSTDFASLASFALACVILTVGQLQCLRYMRREAREKLEQLTFVDELTGVFNYRYLHERLAEELQRAKRHGHPVSVLYLDCDHFKQVNDTYGHETGNMVLRRVCEVMRANIRGEDFIGRLGGDEFLVVLPQTDSSGALIAAERAHQAQCPGPQEPERGAAGLSGLLHRRGQLPRPRGHSRGPHPRRRRSDVQG